MRTKIFYHLDMAGELQYTETRYYIFGWCFYSFFSLVG